MYLEKSAVMVNKWALILGRCIFAKARIPMPQFLIHKGNMIGNDNTVGKEEKMSKGSTRKLTTEFPLLRPFFFFFYKPRNYTSS